MTDNHHQPRGLNRDLFRWIDFESEAERLEGFIAGIRVYETLPDIVELENVEYFPVTRANGRPGGPAFAGGLVGSDGRVLDFAATVREGETPVYHIRNRPEAAVTTVIEEPVIYLGWLSTAFGHVLTEAFARTWALPVYGPSVQAIYHTAPGRVNPSWRRSLLQLHGLGEERVLLPRKPIRFRTLIIPGSAIVLRNSICTPIAASYADVAERIVETPQTTDQPLYFSRRYVQSGRRQVHNEFELEEVLRENGFLVVHPETLSIPEQIRLVNRHRVIWGLQGSALHTVLYSRIKPELTIITIPGELNENYPMISEAVGAPTTFLNGIEQIYSGGRSSLVKQLRITPENVLAHLREVGLLRSQLSASVWRKLPPGTRASHRRALFDDILARTGMAKSYSPDVCKAILATAEESWPLSWAAADYFAGRDSAAVALCLERFIGGIENEEQFTELAAFQPGISKSRAAILAECEPDLRRRVEGILSARLALEPVPPTEEKPRRVRKRPGLQWDREVRKNARKSSVADPETLAPV